MDQTSRLSQGKKCWYPGKGLGQVLVRVVNIVVDVDLNVDFTSEFTYA